MTKETKIGLLVGLAFIILFAIILSEKGTPQRGTASFTVADGSKPASPLGGSDQPLGSAGRLQVTSQLPPIVQPKPQQVTIAPPSAPILSEEPVAQAAPKKDESIAPLPEAVVRALNNIAIKNESSREADERGSLEPQFPSKPSAISPPTVASAEKLNSETKIVSVSPSNQGTTAFTVEPPKPVTEKPPVIRTVHTVQAGESISKITAKYYGRSTPARDEAIFKANRDRLKAMHQVKAGQKLDIPDLGEANAAFEPVTSFSMSDFSVVKTPPATSDAIRIPIPIRESAGAAGPGLRKVAAIDTQTPTLQTASATTASKKNKSAEASYQWYEVRPKDTLSRIARKMLGSEKHTSELFNLNKDRMANKNSLKPGMKIRVPLKSAAMLETPTAVSSSGFGDAD